MGYYWLNHRNEDENPDYYNVEGEIYHYKGSVPGSNKLSEGDKFVYYRPGEYVLFGAGEIKEINKKTEKTANPAIEEAMSGFSRKLTNYYAHVKSYRHFEPLINVRKIKDQISFLKNKDGLRGVPQTSIYQISSDDFNTILEAADEKSMFLLDN